MNPIHIIQLIVVISGILKMHHPKQCGITARQVYFPKNDNFLVN